MRDAAPAELPFPVFRLDDDGWLDQLVGWVMFGGLVAEALAPVRRMRQRLLLALEVLAQAPGRVAAVALLGTLAVVAVGAIALVGLGAILPVDIQYPTAFDDGENKPLDAANRYVLHFDKGQTPPTNVGWSISMYDPQGYYEREGQPGPYFEGYWNTWMSGQPQGRPTVNPLKEDAGCLPKEQPGA